MTPHLLLTHFYIGLNTVKIHVYIALGFKICKKALIRLGHFNFYNHICSLFV